MLQITEMNKIKPLTSEHPPLSLVVEPLLESDLGALTTALIWAY